MFKNPNFRRRGAWLLFAAAVALTARAGENQLGYSYGSETEAKGEAEVYQWLTQRSGKADGRYQATDARTEFDYGFTDRLEGELELASAHYHSRGVVGLDDQDRTAFTGIGVAVKYALRDVDRDACGLALYLEPEYSRFDHATGAREDAYGVEAKLVFQKERGPWTYIANATVEPEWAKGHDGTAHELETVFSHGVSHRLAHGWDVGVENVWRAESEPIRLAQWSRYAVSLGPTVHFETHSWWLTVTWLAQITGWPGTRRGLELEDFERNEFRLKVGFDL